MDADQLIAMVARSEAVVEPMRRQAEELGVRFRVCSTAQQLSERIDRLGVAVIVLEDLREGAQSLEEHRWLESIGFLQPRILLVREAKLANVVKAMRMGVFSVHVDPENEDHFPQMVRDALSAAQADIAQARVREATMERLRALADGELAVLRGMLEGKLNKRVANQLEISERTVEARRKRVFNKMDCRSVAALTRLIVETIGYKELINLCEAIPSSVPPPHLKTETSPTDKQTAAGADDIRSDSGTPAPHFKAPARSVAPKNEESHRPK